jgi:TolB-like protein
MKIAAKTALTAALTLLPTTAFSGDCASIAEKFALAAAKNQIKRVAIVPFVAVHGGETFSGSVVAERLVSLTASRGDLEVIERKLLKHVMHEQKLESFGVIDPSTIRALGKILGVDAIVTGTVLELRNGSVEINARLIDSQTAKVLAADIEKVEKEWPDGGENADVSVPVPSLPDWDTEPTRFSDLELPGVGDCRDQLDQMEASVVDLKAKYWAMRLKDKDFSITRLKHNPGSEIKNAGIRSRFYDQLRFWYNEGAKQLSREEMSDLASQQERIQRLTGTCGS